MAKLVVDRDTSYFHYYNANPKDVRTSDCVVRAICTALDEPYEYVATDMFYFGLELGLDHCDKECVEKYLEYRGWKRCKQPVKSNSKKFRAHEFCKKLMEDRVTDNSTVLAFVGSHHLVAIVNEGFGFRVWDTWNSSECVVGRYWVKG